MNRTDSDESRALQVLDRYLSLQASRVFDEVVQDEPSRVHAVHAGSFGQRRAAAIALLIAGAAILLAMPWLGWTERVNISSFRGEASRLEGTSTWRAGGALELGWGSVQDSSHYSLEVWDSHGGLVASKLFDSTQTAVTIGIGPGVPRPLMWTVVAWQETQRLVASEVMIVMSTQ